MIKKIIYILIFPILFSQTLFGQNNSRTYVNYTSSYYGKQNNDTLIFESKINEITLNSDYTFEFWSRPNISCFTWKNYKGKWKQQRDTIYFYNQYELIESDIKVDYNNNSGKDIFSLKFETDNKKELINKNIKIEYVYDFNANLDNVKKDFVINLDNTLEIPYQDIPNFQELTSIRIEYEINNKEIREGYLTKNRFVNLKDKSIPNIIRVQFIIKPKKEIVHRTVKGISNGKNLKIIGCDKTKTTLTDYTDELKFEKEYELKKE